MTSAVSREQIFERMIASLRQSVNEIENFRLSVRLATVIASITHDKQDIALALEKARGQCSSHLRAEAMAIVAKTLAEARHFSEASNVADEMNGSDQYYKAEARIWIARFSGQALDLLKAEEAIECINMPYLRNEATSDLDLLSSKAHHTGSHSHDKYHSDLIALKKILNEIEGMKDRHKVKPKFTSVHLNMKAQEIIDRLLADAMK